MDIRERLCVATVGRDAVRLVKEYGLGIELDHFCWTENMDEPKAANVNKKIRNELSECGAKRRILHAPFQELFPCAIDPKIKAVALDRFEETMKLAHIYSASRIVVHTGFMPNLYYREWHYKKSVEFWTNFMQGKPDGYMLCIENVLEEDPDQMIELIDGINAREEEIGGRHRYGICLDVGHAAYRSNVPVTEWIRRLGSRIVHTHLHNNDGTGDKHDVFDCKGAAFSMAEALAALEECAAEDVTHTIEALEPEPCLQWLGTHRYLG